MNEQTVIKCIPNYVINNALMEVKVIFLLKKRRGKNVDSDNNMSRGQDSDGSDMNFVSLLKAI